MKGSVCIYSLLACLTAIGLRAQPGDTGQPTVSVRTTLVQVPVLVKTKAGDVVFRLTADDFLLTDDGIPQKLTLDEDTDSQPLALAIVVETGGAGATHLDDYRQLDAILVALIGGVEHRVAVIGFDSTPHLLMPFSSSTDDVSKQLANLHKGDERAAVLDAVAFAVGQLRAQPARYRRAILLLSETIDQGSQTTLGEALRLISDTNTTIYSFAFSSTATAVSHEASKYGHPGVTAGLTGVGVGAKSDEPGPPHGCFSREGADPEYDGHYSKQVLDCISQLVPPLRLATMAFLAARGALRTNPAESIAQLTGGEFFHFHDAKDLKAGLISVSNDVPNFYVLNFRPTSLRPGPHSLRLEIKDHHQLVLKSRSSYWIDDESGR
jgi:VWFA-related protein